MPESRIARADRRTTSLRARIGDEIRVARNSAGLTLAQVGRAAGVSRSETSRIERGDAGWVDLMTRLYDPENYFARFDALFTDGRLPLATAKMNWLRRHRPLSYLKVQTLTVLGALGIIARIWTDPRSRPYRAVYARSLRRLIAARRPPRYLFQFAWKCVMHTHFATMTRQMVRGETGLVNT